MIVEAVSKLIEGIDLKLSEATEVMDEIMSGKATDAQIAGFLVALRIKGETIEEITGCAKSMRQKAANINPKVKGTLVDTCGTGGDKADTFNISTVAAFVVAGAGIPVAKHGNKAVSSKCGSADLLKELGVNIDIPPSKVEKCIEEVGIGFMFAPLFHGAMKYAIGPRKELAIRTIFNVLGPLTNPANAKGQIIGVYDEKLTKPIAEVLGLLGIDHAFVVHGNGLDEITVESESTISELKGKHIETYKIKPTDFGMELSPLSEIKGGDPSVNKQITLDILEGKEKGAKRDVVLLNAAAAIVAGNKADNLKQGIDIASQSIDSGKALEKLNQLIEWTNK